MAADQNIDHHFMNAAARLALRGHGGAEPNPMVGCVIVNDANQIVGWGCHRKCGEAHAEIEALRRAGPHARNTTVYVTLEPCNHTGRTGPCAEALINAGVRRLVIAVRDPYPPAAGGCDRLRTAGIACEVLQQPPANTLAVTAPFVHRIATGLPWVIVKWAQTLDGKIATRHGASKWISSERSRRMVHRERGRVDAILTGIGTILHDDPMLTARHGTSRRTAKRIIIDLHLRTPPTSKVVQTAREFPTIIACDAALESSSQARELISHGVQLLPIPPHNKELPLEPVLRELTARFKVSTVLVEGGPGLVTRLFRQKLVNLAWVFVAPLILGDQHAPGIITGVTADRLTDGTPLKLTSLRRRGPDMMAMYVPERLS